MPTEQANHAALQRGNALDIKGFSWQSHATMHEFKNAAKRCAWQGCALCKFGCQIRGAQALRRNAAAKAHLAAVADVADANMQHFMDETLADVDG